MCPTVLITTPPFIATTSISENQTDQVLIKLSYALNLSFLKATLFPLLKMVECIQINLNSGLLISSENTSELVGHFLGTNLVIPGKIGQATP